ncbi:YjgN family protein [Minwuia sp.]|uniref:YjgN family protein n=1 Tax=Minwuia sp. TaxID=2493630 RepID=UPI003A91D793
MQDDKPADFSNGMIQVDPAAAPPAETLPPESVEETPDEGIELTYQGRWQDVASLALTNALLSFITFGIYSFWGRTRIRRYLWSHTSANGSPLEYHGTGGQIFLGFIIITVIFGIINAIFQFVQTALVNAAVSAGDPAVIGVIFAVSSFVFMVFYLTFFAYITYSVRRYWLAVTSWRGIRLWQGGTRGTLLRMAFPRSLLTVVTAGLCYPWLILKTEGYAYSQSHVGDQQFSFGAKAGPLLRGWLPLWASYFLLVLGPIAALFLFSFTAAMSGDAEAASDIFPSWIADMGKAGAIAFATGFGVAILIAAAAYGFWRARLFNVAVSGISIGNLRFIGRIRTMTFISAYVRAFLLAGIIIAVPGMLIATMLGAFSVGSGSPFAGFFSFLLIFLLFFVVWGFVRNVIIVHGLWKARVEATSTEGTVNVGIIRQAQVRRMRQGEGFGMAFDAGFGEA